MDGPKAARAIIPLPRPATGKDQKRADRREVEEGPCGISA